MSLDKLRSPFTALKNKQKLFLAKAFLSDGVQGDRCQREMNDESRMPETRIWVENHILALLLLSPQLRFIKQQPAACFVTHALHTGRPKTSAELSPRQKMRSLAVGFTTVVNWIFPTSS